MAQEVERVVRDPIADAPPPADSSATLSDELARACAEAARMEEEAELAHVRIQSLEREVAEARAEADRMEDEAERAHARIHELEKALDVIRAALAASESRG